MNTRTFKAFNQPGWSSNPPSKRSTTLTDYFVEVEQKRIGRKVAELKFQHYQSQAAPRSGVGVPGCRGPTPCRYGTRSNQR